MEAGCAADGAGPAVRTGCRTERPAVEAREGSGRVSIRSA
jgi:hypothetical protein